ncbi:CBO2463/CBO2479 domain-containing protein [Companilactobacillus mishanensis]|uniref:Uncharacterized protein n=1 Tax=Companilactobacillus mishanensis TaxID=2486008 RepID=A0A5P0ZH28_9LACO|nr:CBO2463/CBO2479 domain-containing protein [Companilactobacillus mishanensis]MQS44951.1 hypothetical protein [Companilactobacillus mishanensis]MQS52370.1 hypothetical protein [Companilactobacillus mishanensis]MQS89466.1 hypothetical protein [Companilactobacillus mishanensis]
MDEYDKLNYASTESVYEGVISEVTDAGVTIELKGRLGTLTVPKRMLICEHDPQVGHEVGFLMSYPEVLSETPNPDYVQAFKDYKEHREEIKQRTKEREEK